LQADESSPDATQRYSPVSYYVEEDFDCDKGILPNREKKIVKKTVWNPTARRATSCSF
jgi:hypothetical protein